MSSASKLPASTETKQNDEPIPDSRPMAIELPEPDYEPAPPTLRSG